VTIRSRTYTSDLLSAGSDCHDHSDVLQVSDRATTGLGADQCVRSSGTCCIAQIIRPYLYLKTPACRHMLSVRTCIQ
jgi:hypothetical protein